MPSPALSNQQAEFRQGLWRMALGQARDTSGMEHSRGFLQCKPVVDAGLSAVLTNSIDTIVDEFVVWGREWQKNPACLAQAAWANMSDGLPDPSRLLLYGALTLLLLSDPTRESSTNHDVCRPWPDSLDAPSLERANAGSVLYRALQWVAQYPDLTSQPEIDLTMAAPQVLSQLVWAQAEGDGMSDQFVALLALRAREVA